MFDLASPSAPDTLRQHLPKPTQLLDEASSGTSVNKSLFPRHPVQFEALRSNQFGDSQQDRADTLTAHGQSSSMIRPYRERRYIRTSSDGPQGRCPNLDLL